MQREGRCTRHKKRKIRSPAAIVNEENTLTVVAALKNVDLDSALNISIINGFTPMLGETFEVLTFGSRIGDFTTLNGLEVGGVDRSSS